MERISKLSAWHTQKQEDRDIDISNSYGARAVTHLIQYQQLETGI